MLWRSQLILTSKTLAIKLVFWVAPEWFLKATLDQRNFRNFLFEMPGAQLHFLFHYCFLLLWKIIANWAASWSSGNAFVSGAGGLRLKSRAGQNGHTVANGSPPLRYILERSCAAWAQWRGDGPSPLVTRFNVLRRTEVGSASHKSCAASARATTLKILRCKRFHKPQKIIVPQAQVWRFEKCNSNRLTASPH